MPVGAAQCREGESQGCAVGSGDDLHVHAVLGVLRRVVRLVRADAVDGDQGVVDDDVVAFAEDGERFVGTGRPVGRDVQGFVGVLPGGGLRHPVIGSGLGERLVLPWMGRCEQSLLGAPGPAPAGVTGLAVLVQEPGDVLDRLVRMSSMAGHGNLRGSFGRRCDERDHHADEEGPCLVHTR